VEEYIVESPSTIKGYAAFQERLEKLRKDLPSLAAVIEKHLGDMDWYSIPEEIESLPTETTKLYFHTNQPVYQTSTEVFTSQKKLENIPEEKIGRLFMHEGVMSLQESKDAEKVRPVMVRLLSKQASIGDVQNVLAKGGLGGHFSSTELDRIASLHVEKLLNQQKYDIDTLSTWCDGSGNDSKETIADLEESKKYGFRFVGTEKDIAQAIDEAPYFDLTFFCGGDTASNFNQTVCRAIAYGPKVGEPNHELATEVRRANSDEVAKRMRTAKLAKMEELARSEAFITLLAIQSSYSTDADIVSQKFPDNSSPEAVKLAKKIMTKVKARREAINFSDKAALGRLHCNSIHAVKSRIEHLVNPASAETKESGSQTSSDKPSSTDAN
ncbi:MAG: hypothetical protein ACXVBE_12770, partial [Bdellovibrionota bacterium]